MANTTSIDEIYADGRHSPCTTWASSLGQQQALDLWRESVGPALDEEAEDWVMRE